MNRAEMIATINANASPLLRDEILHHMNIGERDYAYDEVCALLDTEDRHETALADGGLTKPVAKEYRQILKDARVLLIEIGFYRVMTGEECDNTWTSSGRTPWHFKLANIPYTTDFTVEEWFDGVDI